jgi:hypothetical protein
VRANEQNQKEYCNWLIAVGVFFLNMAKIIHGKYYHHFLSTLCEMYLKENVSEIEVEIDGRTEVILPTELSLTSKHGVEINVENTKDN